MCNEIYVVAWDYDTGCGFDWYYDKDKSLKAFDVEKKNCETFKDTHWTAYYGIFITEINPYKYRDDITDEIHKWYCELFENYTNMFKDVKTYSAILPIKAASKVDMVTDKEEANRIKEKLSDEEQQRFEESYKRNETLMKRLSRK